MSEKLSSSPKHAVLICTRNRLENLRQTLNSMCEQSDTSNLCLVLVDASDDMVRAEIQEIVGKIQAFPVYYYTFSGKPSATRQRNYGLDHLSTEIEYVSFIDDDVLLDPDLFSYLEEVLRKNPDMGGVGGQVKGPDGMLGKLPRYMFWRRFFLLDDARPGRVLPSAQTSQSQVILMEKQVPVEWLCTCCATFRRKVIDSIRFESRLDGHATDGDLDFTYRVSKQAPLYVDPGTSLVHLESPKNRAGAEQYAHIHAVHRYWFSEKNLTHPLRKPAYWWAMLGRFLVLTASRHPDAKYVRRGLLSGLRVVWQRKHPLLTD